MKMVRESTVEGSGRLLWTGGTASAKAQGQDRLWFVWETEGHMAGEEEGESLRR